MNRFVNQEDSRVTDLIENGGLKKDTLSRRKCIAKLFETFIGDRFNTNISEVLGDHDLLENSLQFLRWFSSQGWAKSV